MDWSLGDCHQLTLVLTRGCRKKSEQKRGLGTGGLEFWGSIADSSSFAGLDLDRDVEIDLNLDVDNPAGRSLPNARRSVQGAGRALLPAVRLP